MADIVFSRIYPESFRDTSEGDSPRMSENTISAMINDSFVNNVGYGKKEFKPFTMSFTACLIFFGYYVNLI
jgi:hypothetical protein